MEVIEITDDELEDGQIDDYIMQFVPELYSDDDVVRLTQTKHAVVTVGRDEWYIMFYAQARLGQGYIYPLVDKDRKLTEKVYVADRALVSALNMVLTCIGGWPDGTVTKSDLMLLAYATSSFVNKTVADNGMRYLRTGALELVNDSCHLYTGALKPKIRSRRPPSLNKFVEFSYYFDEEFIQVEGVEDMQAFMQMPLIIMGDTPDVNSNPEFNWHSKEGNILYAKEDAKGMIAMYDYVSGLLRQPVVEELRVWHKGKIYKVLVDGRPTYRVMDDAAAARNMFCAESGVPITGASVQDKRAMVIAGIGIAARMRLDKFERDAESVQGSAVRDARHELERALRDWVYVNKRGD